MNPSKAKQTNWAKRSAAAQTRLRDVAPQTPIFTLRGIMRHVRHMQSLRHSASTTALSVSFMPQRACT